MDARGKSDEGMCKGLRLQQGLVMIFLGVRDKSKNRGKGMVCTEKMCEQDPQ